MRIACWNVRGLNGPLTQNKVAALCKQHNISIFGMLETKTRSGKIGDIMHSKFRSWSFLTNHDLVDGGRIVIIWNPLMVDCQILEMHMQVIHCKIVNKVNAQTFVCSFIYGSNQINARREL